MPQKSLAFSLLELLIVISIITILTSTALPAYRSLIEQQRTVSLLNQLHTDLQFARGTAITHQQPVSICPGIVSCRTDHVWTQHILIFFDANLNGALDADEKLLKVAELPDSYAWRWSNFRQQPHMTYIENGMTNSLNGTFTLCQDSRAFASIILNRAGRARQSLFKKPVACPQ